MATRPELIIHFAILMVAGPTLIFRRRPAEWSTPAQNKYRMVVPSCEGQSIPHILSVRFLFSLVCYKQEENKKEKNTRTHPPHPTSPPRKLPSSSQAVPRQLSDSSQTAPRLASQTAPRQLPDNSQTVPRQLPPRGVTQFTFLRSLF